MGSPDSNLVTAVKERGRPNAWALVCTIDIDVGRAPDVRRSWHGGPGLIGEWSWRTKALELSRRPRQQALDEWERGLAFDRHWCEIVDAGIEVSHG